MRFSIRETAFSNEPVTDSLIFILTIEVKKHRLFALQMSEKEDHDFGLCRSSPQGGPIFPFVNDRSFGRVVFALRRQVIAPASGSERHLPGRERVPSAPCHDPVKALLLTYDMLDRLGPSAALQTQISSSRRG